MPVTRNSGSAGFTLIELLVATVVFGVIMAGTIGVLNGQQRVHRDSAAIMDARNQLRQAATILPLDLRSVSSPGGDLLAVTDSSVLFRSTIGSSIVCTMAVGSPPGVVLPPLTLSRGNTLTSWVSTPVAGDTVIIFDEGSTTASTDDRWRAHAIASVTESLGGCPVSSGFTTSGDATRPSYVVRISGTPSGTILAGAPVRFVRRSRYSLSRAPDGQWYLGYCSSACTSSGAVSPVAGPLRPWAPPASGMSGAQFTYYDSNGAPTTVLSQIVRVEVVLRAAARTPVRAGSPSRRTYTDSLRVNVAVRNAR